MCKYSEFKDKFSDEYFEKNTYVNSKGCWVWLGAVGRGGYGVACRRDKDNKPRNFYAHRMSYFFYKTDIAEDLQIDHLCRIRRCLNPDHLEAVSSRDNVIRGVSFSAINAKKSHCIKGHPLSGDNLYVNPQGRRKCRLCARECGRSYDKLRRRKKYRGN